MLEGKKEKEKDEEDNFTHSIHALHSLSLVHYLCSDVKCSRS